jgi:polysaccharide pyruvyl transferase CsaB
MEDTLKHGEVLFANGKIKEAEKCFVNILEQDPQNKEALNNLGVIAFQSQQIENAIDYFDKSLKLDPFYKEAVLNYTHLLKELKLLNEASPFLYKIMEKYPNDKELNQLLNEIEMVQKPKRKIAVLCLPGLESFLQDIVDFLQTKYEVLTCYSNNNRDIEAAAHWADIVWLEWANQMAVHVTNKVPQIKDKKVICRLHGYEVFTDLPTQINWSVVDQLIFVAKHKQQIFNQKFKIQFQPQTILRNGVNTNKFTIAENKQNTKRLVLLGHINFRKGLPLLLQFYHELLRHDPEYYLYIRGDFQDHRLEVAALTMINELSLSNKLEFVDWVDDLNTWLADKSHILSFSLEESFHYAIGNGMAAGMKPVIHAWNESREIWPNRFVFKDLSEFLQLVMEDSYNPEEYRKWVETHVSASSQMKGIKDILTSLGSHIAITYNDIRNYYNKRYHEKQEHTMRPEKSYDVFLDRLNVRKGKRLLDVACGTGYLVKASRDRGLDAFGIDISFEASKVSRRVVGDDCILNCLGESLPFKRKTFDYISCIGSLEHFLDLNKGLQEIRRVLKDEGSVCIVVPNENFIGWQNKSQKGTAQQEINENLDSLDGWEEVLKNNGFEILNVFQDNAVCPNLKVADDLCYQFIFICHKKRPDIKVHYRPTKVLMTGGYGFGNIGDEAILKSYIKLFKADSQLNFRIRLITGNPMETNVLHPDIEKAIQWDRRMLEKELIKTDILLFGGGGIFFDFNNPKLKNIENRCFISNKASGLGKKVVFLGIGVDNLYIQENRKLLKETLNKSALITVRDFKSLECLKEIGITREIHLTADPVFSSYNGRVNDCNTKDSSTIGLCLRPTNELLHKRPEDDTILAEKVAVFLNHLLDNTTYSLEFISCKPGYDDLYAKELISYINDANRCKIIPTKHWNEVIEHQKKYRAFIGMSLHSLIFAFMNHVPIIGISYCTKVDSLFDSLNMSQFSIQMDEDVTSRLKSCWETLEQGDANFNFSETNNALKLKAVQNIELLKICLINGAIII